MMKSLKDYRKLNFKASRLGYFLTFFEIGIVTFPCFYILYYVLFICVVGIEDPPTITFCLVSYVTMWLMRLGIGITWRYDSLFIWRFFPVCKKAHLRIISDIDRIILHPRRRSDLLELEEMKADMEKQFNLASRK